MVSLCTRNKVYRRYCSGAEFMGSAVRDLGSHASLPILAVELAKEVVSVSAAGKQGCSCPSERFRAVTCHVGCDSFY